MKMTRLTQAITKISLKCKSTATQGNTHFPGPTLDLKNQTMIRLLVVPEKPNCGLSVGSSLVLRIIICTAT